MTGIYECFGSSIRIITQYAMMFSLVIVFVGRSAMEIGTVRKMMKLRFREGKQKYQQRKDGNYFFHV